ncbi:MAG: hypothetical protein QOF24_231 [Verrucomicrobiota bacterium]|jgi:hypothetical protein
MLDSLLVVLGFVLIAAGLMAVIKPVRWLGLGTRQNGAIAVMVGVFLEFAAGNMLDSFLFYLGLFITVAALLSLIRPIRFLYIQSRRVAAMVLAGGLLIVIVALFLPAGNEKVSAKGSKLDEWMPRWQIGEQHTIRVAARPEAVFAAVHAVRADEILLFRTLIAIRRCGQTGPESIMNPAEEKSLLDVATETTFALLAEEPPREIVIGTVVAAPHGTRARSSGLTPDLFRRKLPPGVALATMNFLVLPDERGGSIVSTQTRIYANDTSALRRFAVYWRIIHPGSDIIRRMWLRAIKKRAEGKAAS